MLNGNSNSQNLLKKYYPQTLGDVVGQPEAVRTLASFAKGAAEGRDGQAVFLLHGPTGVGKTAAAFAFARELGCGVDHEELAGCTKSPAANRTAGRWRSSCGRSTSGRCSGPAGGSRSLTKPTG